MLEFRISAFQMFSIQRL